jgi:hypothetical protein
MLKLRLVHFYLGVFFAPLILFFAFSGVLQVFKLHEAYREVPGSQGDWIAWFGQFHKEQAWIPPRVAPARPRTPDAARKSGPDDAPKAGPDAAPKAERDAAQKAGSDSPPKAGAKGSPMDREKSPASRPMKWLVAAMGVALMITSILGLWIASGYRNRRRGFFVALAAGIVVPLALMAA